MIQENVIFFQMFEAESSTYTYILADAQTREAVVIDPVRETVDRDWRWLLEADLRLTWILETHVHADHITGAGRLRELSGAKIAVAKASGVSGADRQLVDGDEVRVGGVALKVLATPGHTDGCLSFYGHGRVFTGDALLIRGCGRTDFQQGSAERLYVSVTEKLFRLPAETLVYPGHDYRGMTSSTIGMERQKNPRLGGGKTLAEFQQIMGELKLPPPKQIEEAVPANLRLGLACDERIFRPQNVNGIPEVQAEDVASQLGKKFRLIDVRQPDEYHGELGHIPGAELVTLGPELMRFLSAVPRDQEIVFVCRSGGRSGQATALSRDLGFARTANLTGGMLRWNELGLKVQR